jgi:hypothetical protein
MSKIITRALLSIGCAAALMTAGTTLHAQERMRFEGMDTNRDGVISRTEWRGNDRAFANQDWNGDGQLSGD